MPYTPEHFGDGLSFRLDRALFETVDRVQPEDVAEQIPVPEATESDFAAFEALREKLG